MLTALAWILAAVGGAIAPPLYWTVYGLCLRLSNGKPTWMGEEVRSALFILASVYIGLGVPLLPAALLMSRLPSPSARRSVIVCYFVGMAVAVLLEKRQAQRRGQAERSRQA